MDPPKGAYRTALAYEWCWDPNKGTVEMPSILLAVLQNAQCFHHHPSTFITWVQDEKHGQDVKGQASLARFIDRDTGKTQMALFHLARSVYVPSLHR